MHIALAFAPPTPPIAEAPPVEIAPGGGDFAALLDARLVPASAAVRIAPAGALPIATIGPPRAVPTQPNAQPAAQPNTAPPASPDPAAPLAADALANGETVEPAPSAAATALPVVVAAPPAVPRLPAEGDVARLRDDEATRAPAHPQAPAVTAATLLPVEPTQTQPPRDHGDAGRGGASLPAVAAQPAAEPARAESGTAAAVVTADAASVATQTAAATPVVPGPPAPPSAAGSAARPAAPALPTHPDRLVADVAVEVARQVSAGRSEFSIRLDPPELGRIDVSLEFSGAEVRAVVSTDNPATHDLLRRDADAFMRLLADSGFRADGGALRFDLRDGGQQRGLASDTRPREAGELAAEPQPLQPPRPMRRGLVDLVA
jgi:hypothetical protein